MPALESLRYARGSLQVLDQLKVPQEKVFAACDDADAAWKAIHTMQVRGAPLIAMVAALGLAVEATKRECVKTDPAQKVAVWLRERTAYLRTSRPTAVNLFNAMDELDAVVAAALVVAGASGSSVRDAYVSAAEQMLEADVAANKSIGEAGADAVIAAMERAGRAGEKARMVTICNTGSLATAGWGTALGIIRSLHARGRLERVYALETRPYNQGARLTAFEIVEDGLPGTLVCDSMAAALMRKEGIDACVVGADRVAANGDTANKIGTYGLSVIARHHGVPFFVASPTTSLDAGTASGDDIHIEERPADELCCIKLGSTNHRIAPEGIEAWNPAFDVTPASLISGIVTERGIIAKASDGKSYDVKGCLDAARAKRAKLA